MKKKVCKTLGLLLAGTMLMSLVGCGSTDETTQTSQSAGTTTAATADAGTQAESTDAEPVTIKITWWGGDGRHASTQKVLDLYTQEHPNVTFEALPAGWDGYFDKLSIQAASGSMPDIVQMDYLYISTYAKNNSLADLQSYIDSGAIDTTNVAESLLATGNIDGKMVGIPLSTSALAVTYNPTVIEAAGAEVPTDDWTWEDYIEMNKKVAESTGQPSALAATAGIFGDTNIFNYWVRSHGATLFNADGTDLGYTDDAIAAEFFQMWKDMADANVAPDADEQAQIAGLGKEGLPIVTDEAASDIEWNNLATTVSSINDHLKLAVMPNSTDKGMWLKPGMFFSVAETSQVKDECVKFIDWFINSEEANAIIAGERGTPVSSAIREYMVNSGTLTTQQQEMFDYTDKVAEIAGETPAPDPSGISEINAAFANVGNSVLYGKMTADEAAAEFRKQVKSILANNAQ